MIFDFLNASTEMNVFELIQKVMTDTKYLAQLQESKDPQAQSREENLGELLSVAKDFITEQPEGGLAEFLEKVALVNDVDSYEGEDDRVTLMTIHSAKGLEFPLVFLPGMDEGIFPGVRSFMEPAALEEERRLCYVAITRAKEELYMSNAHMRTMYGKINSYMPSRFIEEIPPDLVDKVITEEDRERVHFQERSRNERASRFALSEAASPVKKLKPKAVSARYDWQVGDTAVHTMWGKGKVVSVTGSGKNMILNNVYAAKYDEKGYLENWTTYQTWLQNTLNHKMVLLEIGEGNRFPSIIKNPFQRIALFQQKAGLYCVDGEQNPIAWLLSLC